MPLNDESGFRRITNSYDWDGEEITPCYVCEGMKSCDPVSDCWLLDVYARLRDYEDCGHSPEEVKDIIQWRHDVIPQMKRMVRSVEDTAERLGDLAQADKENRVIILPWDRYNFEDEVMGDAVRKAEYMFEATGDTEVNKFIYTAVMEKCCRDGKGWCK